MCAQDRPDEDEHSIRIHAGRDSDAYLQRVSRQLGYTIVTWRGRHIAEPTELAAQEASGYWLEVLQLASALQRHYQPVKMNDQTLGNAVPHLHTQSSAAVRAGSGARPSTSCSTRSRAVSGSTGAHRSTCRRRQQTSNLFNAGQHDVEHDRVVLLDSQPDRFRPLDGHIQRVGLFLQPSSEDRGHPRVVLYHQHPHGRTLAPVR